MNLLKVNQEDEFSIEVTEDVPEDNQFEFTDNTVEARKPYYYRVVAITEGVNGQKLTSKLSLTKTGQAHNLTPPEPPEWAEFSRDSSGSHDTIHLEWRAVDQLTCIVLRRNSSSDFFRPVSNWEVLGEYNENLQQWIYTFKDNILTKSEDIYVYKIKVKSKSGNINVSEESDEI